MRSVMLQINEYDEQKLKFSVQKHIKTAAKC